MKSINGAKITLIIIIPLATVLIGCFEEENSIPEVKPDDIQITLINQNPTENLSEINITVIIENTQDHTIHLEGGFRHNLLVENGSYASNGSIWIESHSGEDWEHDYRKEIHYKINFATANNDSYETYQIQFIFYYSDKGGTDTERIAVSSNIVYYNTTKVVDSIIGLDW